MRIKGVFGILYIATEWLTRLAMVNLLWIGLNLPIVLIALNIYMIHTVEELFQIIVVIALLTPFLFFPASTAMAALIKEWVIDSKDINIMKPFFTAYKKYYMKSMLGGIIITVLWAILAVDFYYFSQSFPIVKYILYFLFVFLFVFTLYFFSSLTYDMDLKLRDLLKVVLISTISRPFLSFALAIISMIAVYICFNILTFLIPLLVGSFISLISCLAFHYTIQTYNL